MIEWPDHLVEDLARRRAVLFLGSGVSKNSTGQGGKRPPTWAEFLLKGLDRLGAGKTRAKELIKRGDLLTACEEIKSKLDDGWDPFVLSEFLNPQYKPASIHDDLLRLDLRIVITQNVDKIYDTHAQNVLNGSVAIKNYYDSDVAKFVRGRSPVIIKAHGTIDSPDRMVFTRSEYSAARYSHGSFYGILDALALTHTFVFLGCGLSDPDVQMMLEKHAHLFGNTHPHYMVMPKEKCMSDIVEGARKSYNLKILGYDPKSNHAALGASIAELANTVDGHRKVLAKMESW